MCIYRIADNLPVATRLEFNPNREAGTDEEQKKDIVKDVQFEHGYRLGFTDGNKVSALTASVTKSFLCGGWGSCARCYYS